MSLAGRLVRLTPKEFRLLSALCSEAGQVVEHGVLGQLVWGEDWGQYNAYPLRSCVRSLRRKLEDSALEPRYILTRHKVGYQVPASEDL